MIPLDDATKLLNDHLYAMGVPNTKPLPEGYELTDELFIPQGTVAKRVRERYLKTISKSFTEGGRHDALIRYAGVLRGCGYDNEIIEAHLIEFDNKCCSPPKNDAEERQGIIAYVCSKPSGMHKRKKQGKNHLKKPDFIFEKLDADGMPTGIYEINYPVYADALKTQFSIVFFNDTIYIYDRDEHLFRKHTNEIGTEIQTIIDVWGISPSSYSKTLSELITRLKNKGGFAIYPFNRSPNKIPVQNGVIEINYDTNIRLDYNSLFTIGIDISIIKKPCVSLKHHIKLLEHSPEHMFTYKLSVTYDPEIKMDGAIKLLKRFVHPDDIKTLTQVSAQALLQMQTGHAYKKAYILDGEPNSGKSSYFKLLYEVFSTDHRSGVSLQQLCNDRFVGGALEGKLLNIYDDLEDVKLGEIAQFKALTGDCNHDIERKHEGRYTGRITAVHVFSCNHPPDVPDKAYRDSAFWQRWEYLKFTYWYATDPNFYQKCYTKERISSFFNLILTAMIKIKKNGLLTNSDVQTVMHEWTISNNPLAGFLEYGFKKSDGRTREQYSKEKFHNAYLKYCETEKIEDRKVLRDRPSFTTALQSFGFKPDRIMRTHHTYQIYETREWEQKTNVEIDLIITPELTTLETSNT